MSRQIRKPRPPRRRTAPTVVRTHLAVITVPSSTKEAQGIHHELNLVKAALLYADTVEVLSLGNQVIHEATHFPTDSPEELWAYLGALDDDSLRKHTGANVDLDKMRKMLSLFSEIDPQMRRELSSDQKKVVDQAREQSRSSMKKILKDLQQERINSGVAQLEEAVARKLVKINDKVDVNADDVAVIDTFVSELSRYLLDPQQFVLLDATVGTIARSLIEEGHIQLPPRSASNSMEATLGTGILARLPAFTAAPFDEVMDLRKDLEEPLGRYRRKVSHLRSDMQTEPFDQHIQAEVDAIWRNEVDPAIAEIYDAMAGHSLVREVLKSAGTNVSDFAKGVAMPAGLTVWSANMLDFGTAVAAGLSGVAAVAPTITGALLKRQEGRASARSHDLYYLYEVDCRLSS